MFVSFLITLRNKNLHMNKRERERERERFTIHLELIPEIRGHNQATGRGDRWDSYPQLSVNIWDPRIRLEYILDTE